MHLTLRQRARAILQGAGWSLPDLPLLWSSRLRSTAGLFVIEKDSRGTWNPEIRLSTPLIRRPDRSWPVEVCGCWCKDPESVLRRILEHELVHYKLWHDGQADWGHTERFRLMAWQHFGHPGIRHGIGRDEE